MCLAVPAKIIKRSSPDLGEVELEGFQKVISLLLVPDANVGDYVIVHVGFALSKLDQKEAEETLKTMQGYHEIY